MLLAVNAAYRIMFAASIPAWKHCTLPEGSGTNFLASSISPRIHKAMQMVPLSDNASLNTSRSYRAFTQ
jgi:hypothetical protein